MLQRKRMWYPCRTLSCSRGLTLIELIIVLTMTGIMLAVATHYWRGMSDKYNLEAQVKQMQVDIEKSRMAAMTNKQRRDIVINPSGSAAGYSFVSYSTEFDPGQVRSTKQVHFPLQQFDANAKSYSAISNLTISFDSHGCLSSTAPLYLAVGPGISGPAVNGVVVQTAKTNIGLIDGGTCVIK